MKLNRRQSIAAGIGGVFAAPDIAKQANQPVNYPHPPSVSTMPFDAIEKSNPIENELKRQQHIAELLKVSKGEFLPYQLDQLVSIDRETHNCDIESLKSISQSFRNELYRRQTKRRYIKNYIDDAKNSLLRHFGIKS